MNALAIVSRWQYILDFLYHNNEELMNRFEQVMILLPDFPMCLFKKTSTQESRHEKAITLRQCFAFLIYLNRALHFLFSNNNDQNKPQYGK